MLFGQLFLSLLHNIFILLNVYTNNPLILNYIDIGGGITEVWSYKNILKNIFMSLLLSGETQMGGGFMFHLYINENFAIVYIL